MNNSKLMTYSFLLAGLCLLAVGFSLSSCTDSQSTIADSMTTEDVDPVDSRFVVKGGPNLVEITTGHDHDANLHTFDLNVDEVPEGWTSFELTNGTHVDHFFLLYRVPQDAIDAATAANQSVLDHWYQTVTVPFQNEWDPLYNGTIGFGTFVNNLFEAVLTSAPWFPQAVVMGGPGITAAGHSSLTTVHLTEGVYVAECYVKDENGEFHSYNGMLEMLEVTGENSEEPEPRPTFNVTISQSGIENPEAVRPGKHTVAIHFDEQPAFGYEHLLGHNVQLVRLSDDYDQALLDELGDWVDWSAPEGLQDSSPVGTTFLGGAMEMVGGSTAYFTVNLRPGNYAWIAEVPDPEAKNMLKTFSVPFGRNVK